MSAKIVDSSQDSRHAEFKAAQKWYSDAIKLTMDGKTAELDKHITTYLQGHARISIRDILTDFKAEGRTLMHLAASSGHSSIMSLLLSKANVPAAVQKELVNVVDDRGFTPLINATIAESAEVMKMLLEKGAEVKKQNTDGASAIHFAAGDGSVERLKLLIDAGAPATQVSLSGGSPLHWAAGKGRADALGYLLSMEGENSPKKTSLNQASPQGGLTPVLMAASACGDVATALLVKAGADTGLLLSGGLTLLHICAENGLVHAVEAILDQARPDAHTANDVDRRKTLASLKTANFGNTPLDLAAMGGKVAIIQLLLSFTDDCPFRTVEEAMSAGPELLRKWNELNDKEVAAAAAATTAEKDKSAQGVFQFTPSTRRVESTEAAANTEDAQLAESHKADGNIAFKNKQYDDAIKAYSSAIALDGANHVFWSNRSAVYLAMGNAADALLDAEVSRRLAPTWPKGCYRLGTARMACGLYEDAAVAAFEGIKLDNNNKDLKALTQEAVRRGKAEHQKQQQKQQQQQQKDR